MENPIKWTFVASVLFMLLCSCDLFTTENPEQTEYSLTISLIGEGSVLVFPNRTVFADGEHILLTADADDGWSFVRWEGDLSDIVSSVDITISEDLSVVAVFAAEYSVATTVTGDGYISLYPESDVYISG